jgi:hypothetical protein
MKKIRRLFESENGAFEDSFDESFIDDLVELVGSEEEIEAAAEACYEELIAAFEKNEVEVDDDVIPEKLAISALILKLVEAGKLDPNEADNFLEENLG